MDPSGRRLTGRALERRVVLAMIKRRAAGAGLPPSTCCHTFRATGVTAYLSNSGTLEHAQQIDTTTAAGRLGFGIFAALAELERELILERTVAGLKAARACGRKGGRKFALTKAGPGRDGAPRHVGVRAVPGARHQGR